MPGDSVGYVNILIDWNQDGQWGGSSTYPDGTTVPEHVLVNFQVPNPYDGTLSALGPANFTIGPTSGYVWTRFSITEDPGREGWDGSGKFEDGEFEDYLLRVGEIPPVGGIAIPVNKVMVLAPWLVLAAVVAVIAVVAIRRRRAA